ncbi:hypothetical protein [Streptomyces sp. NPDC097619]|uniref:hypothetical protein n=1 Tax=Streptomyces sp. NPDC097619 TaxID=3157228 RepID=UPI00331934CC
MGGPPSSTGSEPPTGPEPTAGPVGTPGPARPRRFGEEPGRDRTVRSGDPAGRERPVPDEPTAPDGPATPDDTGTDADAGPRAKEYVLLALVVLVSLAALTVTVLAAVRGGGTATRDALTTALVPARGDSTARALLGSVTLLTLLTGGLALAGGRFRRVGLHRTHRLFRALAVLSVPVLIWIVVDASDTLVLRTGS